MSRGGYRLFAGRKREHDRTVGKLAVDIGKLHRSKYLDLPLRLEWTWSTGQVVLIETFQDEVVLNYSFRRGDAEWKHIRQHVAITHTPCHYGGGRPWFVCPGCGSRCAKLYISAAPACRKCAGLRYAIQSDDPCARSWTRTRKLEEQLSGGTGQWNFTRPKRMRWKTYSRLIEAHSREQNYRDAHLIAATKELLGDADFREIFRG